MIDIRWKLLVVTTSLIFYHTAKSEGGVTKSQLCNISSDVSCSCQIAKSTGVPKKEKDFCAMKYFKRNSSECHNLPITGDVKMPFPGNVTLQSYLFVHRVIYTQTAFNITFSDISWQELRMRFQENGREKDKNFCREFSISSDSSTAVKPILFFDCLWSYSNYETLTYHLEIAATKGGSTAYKKYTFVVPSSQLRDPKTTSMKDWEIFMYVDVSQPHRLVLHFEPLPLKFGVNKYIVMMTGTKSMDKKEIQVIPEEGEQTQLITIAYNTPADGDPYTFSVVPVHDKCGVDGCRTTKSSPIIFAENMDSLIGLYIVIGLSIFSIAFILICLNRTLSRSQSDIIRPKVLFIYKNTHQTHVNMIEKIADYLEEANMSVLLDKRGIETSVNKDPYDWYLQAFEEAEVILVFSSLQCCADQTVGIHRRVDDIALVQLKGSMTNKKHRYATILLPYCKTTDIPIEASKFPLFKIPKAMDELLTYIRDDKYLTKVINMSCIDKTLDAHLTDLHIAMKEARLKLLTHTHSGEAKHQQICHEHINVNMNNVVNTKVNRLNKLEEVDEMLDTDDENEPTEQLYPCFTDLNLTGEDSKQLISNNNKKNDDFNPLDNLNL